MLLCATFVLPLKLLVMVCLMSQYYVPLWESRMGHPERSPVSYGISLLYQPEPWSPSSLLRPPLQPTPSSRPSRVTPGTLIPLQSHALACLLQGRWTERAEMLLDLYPLQLLIHNDAFLFLCQSVELFYVKG